jgi:uncharacterized LabA/DUF88 family protein
MIAQDVASIAAMLRTREKVCIFVDNTDLFDAIQQIRNTHGKKVDYIKLKEILANDRVVNRANFYFSEPSPPKFYFSDPPYSKEVKDEGDESLLAAKKRQGFYYVLQKAGYSVICLPQRERYDPQSGEYYIDDTMSLEIVYDMCSMSQKNFDTIVLVAGSEDYARIVGKLRQDSGVNVEVAFFGSSCSAKLRDMANRFIDLEQDGIMRELFRGMEIKDVVGQNGKEY